MTPPTPCMTTPDNFFNPETMREAAQACFDCWFFEECREMGTDETYGVWAGEIKPDSLAEIAKIDTAKDNTNAERAAELYREGASAREIAEVLNLSYRRVQALIAPIRQELQRGRIDTERTRQAVIEALELGLNNADTAIVAGVNARTVQRVKHALAAERAIDDEAHAVAERQAVTARLDAYLGVSAA